jgi:hypothetical protein
MSITRLQKASVVLHLFTGIITSFIVYLKFGMSLLLWAVNFMPETVPSHGGMGLKEWMTEDMK